MKKYCANCGSFKIEKAKYCHQCGHKLGLQANEIGKKKDFFIRDYVEYDDLKEYPTGIDPDPFLNLDKINEELRLNKPLQRTLKGASYVSILFFIFLLLTLFEWSPIHESYVVTFISSYLFLLSLFVVFYVLKRQVASNPYIVAEDLLAEWSLEQNQLEKFAQYLFMKSWRKIKFGLLIAFVFSIVSLGVSILVLDINYYVLLVYVPAILILIIIGAYSIALSRKKRENAGNALVLLADKYAYVNGNFYDWRKSSHGLAKFRVIKKPFYGLGITYLHNEGKKAKRKYFEIPANESTDLKRLVRKLKALNN